MRGFFCHRGRWYQTPMLASTASAMNNTLLSLVTGQDLKGAPNTRIKSRDRTRGQMEDPTVLKRPGACQEEGTRVREVESSFQPREGLKSPTPSLLRAKSMPQSQVTGSERRMYRGFQISLSPGPQRNDMDSTYNSIVRVDGPQLRLRAIPPPTCRDWMAYRPALRATSPKSHCHGTTEKAPGKVSMKKVIDVTVDLGAPPTNSTTSDMCRNPRHKASQLPCQTRDHLNLLATPHLGYQVSSVDLHREKASTIPFIDQD